ncbi:MAG TPA: hypothetical protein VHK26_12795 [Methyloceanibacter sp.]|jgi:hypothetical protein|nr:hypothetical protein [Methyloceanibacter sp.]
MMANEGTRSGVLGHNDALFATKTPLSNTGAAMPTLFRFLMIIGVIAGIVTGSLYVLAEYFQPEPKEISKALRNIKARMEETTASTPSADAGAVNPAAMPDPGPDPDEMGTSKGSGRRAQ